MDEREADRLAKSFMDVLDAITRLSEADSAAFYASLAAAAAKKEGGTYRGGSSKRCKLNNRSRTDTRVGSELEVTHAKAETPAKVGRVKVTVAESEMSMLVLAAWNEQAGQQLSSTDWHRKIIARLREHPELGVPEHAHIIAVSLAAPWWDGPASPSVVYGSGAQFERSILAVTSRRPGNLVDRMKAKADQLQGEGR